MLRAIAAGLMTLDEVEAVRVVMTPAVRPIAFVVTFVGVRTEGETVCKSLRRAEREVGIIVECGEDQQRRI
jgi:chloramphenicol 3-O-phosphotransferase